MFRRHPTAAMQAGGSDPSQLGQQLFSDPAQTFSLLAAVSDDIETVGTETVDGIATTRYRTTVDIAQALATTAGAEQLRALEALVEGDIPIEVWIDEQGLPRKQTMSIPYAGEQQGTTASITVDGLVYGGAVTVRVPAPSTVRAAPTELSGAAA